MPDVGGLVVLALLTKASTSTSSKKATLLDFIVVSAGQRGLNLRPGVGDLIRITAAQVVEVSEGQ